MTNIQGIRVLVVCNAYPSEAHLYRNGFIHRRVLAYQQAGMEVDVFYNHEPIVLPYEYEFEGVRVSVGNQRALEAFVRDSTYDAYLVHFAEPSRIEPLVRAGVSAPVLVWVHGYEAEAWHRRWFNFMDSPEQIRSVLEKRDSYYAGQNEFFHQLLVNPPLDLTFINVSRWFQRYVVEPDVRAEFPPSAQVIANIVDTDLFTYRPKSPADRFKVLSIRPFASRKYANDISTAAIVELSKRPCFGRFSFTIVGEGPLFATETAPLEALANVTLENRFLSQDEIVEYHARHGVFLCPTRFDSQGVSMCEAVSSGLVAISTDISAIPEFIHHGKTGLLTKPEDPVSVADALEQLCYDEELFGRLSVDGSAWMAANVGPDATTSREVELIASKVRS